jgi:hypothetical protein
MSLKSISTFIASVLLVSLTISTGIIIYYFVTSLPKTQMKEVSSLSKQVASCNGGMFEVKYLTCREKNLMKGLVLWLKFDEGSGSVAYDSSGNNNHGTFYGWNPHYQYNNTLVYLNGSSTVNLTHYFYLPSKAILSDVNLTVYFKNNTIDGETLKVYVNNNYIGPFSSISSSPVRFVNILKSNFTAGAINTITYEGNATNITQTELRYLQDIGWVNGQLGKAISFDGVDDYLSVPHSSSLNFTNEITITFWVKLYQTIRYWAPITSKQYDRTTWWIGFPGGSSNYIASSNYNLTNYRFDFIIPDTLNTWRFVGITYKDGLGRRGYADGNLISSDSSSGWLINEIGSIIFGRGSDGVVINGAIDDVRIYNRSLYEEEIRDLYYNDLTNRLNVTFSIVNNGLIDLGNNFSAIIYFKDGSSTMKNFNLENSFDVGSEEKVSLIIENYTQSYGGISKLEVCSLSCPQICAKIEQETQC